MNSPAVYVLQPQRSSHTMFRVSGPIETDVSPPTSRRRDRRFALALAAILLLLRLPLLEHPTPVHPDELNFTAALGFPQPYPVQPPGYPLWVGLGTAARSVGFSSYAALQIWSLAASIALPLTLFLLLRRVCPTPLAWWLALTAGINPLIWFHAVTAMTYVPAGAVGLAVLGLCHRSIIRQSAASACVAALVLVIGVFLRADLLIFLGPLLLYATWRSKPGSWPALLILAGGLSGYAVLTSAIYRSTANQAELQSFSHTIDVILGTSVFELGLVDGLVRNCVKIALNLAWDLGVAVLLIIPAVVNLIRRRKRDPRQFLFLLLWALPILFFLLFMHVVQGYFILLVLAVYFCIGLYLRDRFAPAVGARIAAIIAICSLCQFSLYPWSAESTGFKRLLDAKIAFLSASGLRQIDKRASIHEPGDFWPTAAHESTPAAATAPADD